MLRFCKASVALERGSPDLSSSLHRIPGSKKSPEGPVSRPVSSLSGRPAVVPDHGRRSVANGAVSSPLAGKVRL